MSKTNAIEIRDLHKSYGKVEALRGVNFEVKQGELFGFLGPNGAGKTTTIRCILDISAPRQERSGYLGWIPKKIRWQCITWWVIYLENSTWKPI